MKKETVIKCLNDKIKKVEYQFCYWTEWNYSILNFITYKTKFGKHGFTYNDIIIMADTETSKKHENVYDIKEHKDGTITKQYIPHDNHVVCWTISLRAHGNNICTLYGRTPVEMIECIEKIHNKMKGEKTFIYFHFLGYDYIFLRKFFMNKWGVPVRELNTKPLYPVLKEYANGIIFKDSLILAQRKLEKWANDLDVEHKKAVGKWDYDKLRNQNTPLNSDELEYIEHDTLAGVECIDKLKNALGKDIGTLPYTATGIVREDIKKAGKEAGYNKEFVKMVPDLDVQEKLELAYHGGFTHANRHEVGWNNENVKCFDFASSYPFVLLSEKFPVEKFTKFGNKSKEYIIRNSGNYAFLFKFVAVDVELKNDKLAMPPLQYSKCTKTINAVVDNGRILCASYVEIELTEQDLIVIDKYYNCKQHCCCDVYVSKKEYLPEWLTNKIYGYFTAKTQLKGSPDKVAYDLAKARVNSVYGLMCQKPITEDIIEEYKTGNYIKDNGDKNDKYEHYKTKKDNVLLYQWGVWCTAYAFKNIFSLGECVDFDKGGKWLYTDTDSCYSTKWNEEKLQSYNNECIAKIQNAGFGPVVQETTGKIYNLGIAEFDGAYSEYVALGAKRYCARDKETGDLKITVAGVPKKTGVKCLHDDINNFKKGFVFDGETTGKLTHHYNFVPEIYTDENGNLTGDSVDLSNCDYLLDSVENMPWELTECYDVTIQVYGE